MSVMPSRKDASSTAEDASEDGTTHDRTVVYLRRPPPSRSARHTAHICACATCDGRRPQASKEAFKNSVESFTELMRKVRSGLTTKFQYFSNRFLRNTQQLWINTRKSPHSYSMLQPFPTPSARLLSLPHLSVAPSERESVRERESGPFKGRAGSETEMVHDRARAPPRQT